MKPRNPPRARVQQGFAAIAAVFLVVVLAALGAFMVSLSRTQHLTQAQDVQGSRVYWAARAGIEWGIAQVLAGGACPASSTTFAVQTASVTVTCGVATYSDGAASNVRIYALTSVAKLGSSTGLGVERSLTATVER